MGQDISQPTKCNIERQQQQKNPEHPHFHQNQKNIRNSNEIPISFPKNWSAFNSNSSSSVNEQQHRHRHHHHHQKAHSFFPSPNSYDSKAKVHKKLSVLSKASISSDYQNVSITSDSSCNSGNISYTPHTLYYDKIYQKDPDSSGQLSYVQLRQHQRKHSQGTDSGIYCASSVSSTCRCSSSSAVSTCGSTTGSSSAISNKTLDKQKSYLSHHLYIKSYLDILEEDEKARAHFKPARPGIRNYTPKILTESSSEVGDSSGVIGIAAATRTSRSKIKDDPWI